ncbi:uncharacterized protein PITG_18987 [Phytophthora infestans T30-4]|uniref:Uncharacterized protein n=1 Tax=Phytophthora infestans (strain T30-4) TaxID=403677 RepID=D0NYP9_PHYIT|nr:uncharacterized protein PITG_18987 [Phytophthora infestans T30-4]EEY68678.1 hypothetical protein PITG_18987 [Phytophthora infestans T30-4]|eukprot:XP_002997484.1 hypothetical protein PITG_18987 [Phytophthora infestans T30-4]
MEGSITRKSNGHAQTEDGLDPDCFENEAKADARRADEEKRRRDEFFAHEERYRDEKKEAEERRLQENVERDERAQRDHEDARARTQELAMIIVALTKKP